MFRAQVWDSHAPEWTGNVAVDHDRPVSDRLRLFANATLNFQSDVNYREFVADRPAGEAADLDFPGLRCEPALCRDSPGIVEERMMDECSSCGTPGACLENLAPGAGRSSDKALR